MSRPKPASHVLGRGNAAAWLDEAAAMGDPVADILFGRLARAGRLPEIDEILAGLQSTGDMLPASLPKALQVFLRDEGLPTWTELPRLMRAQRFAERHSVAIASALFCASLPMAFTGAKGVSVLYATRKLHEDVDTRVNETGRFVFDVLMPGGFETGRAIRSTQKVRLLHAAVRHTIFDGRRAARKSDGFVPINQEELLGTLICFSVVVLDALTKMGIAITEDEAADFLYLWQVVGTMLGIREKWLPRSLTEARRLGETIRARQGSATDAGRELASVLVDGIERHLPARGLRVMAPGLMRFFLGEETARLLGLPEGMRASDLARLVPKLTRLVDGWERSPLGRLLPRLGRDLLERVMDHKLAGKPPTYERPLAPRTSPPRVTAPKAPPTKAPPTSFPPPKACPAGACPVEGVLR